MFALEGQHSWSMRGNKKQIHWVFYTLFSDLYIHELLSYAQPSTLSVERKNERIQPPSPLIALLAFSFFFLSRIPFCRSFIL
ncbi:hypothetical protein BKA57DRAFT_63831 [Linnemannia elongata]|nr:hypothetical protein BKA57DRAFT_63831 [Linnemannia elongata]